MELAKKERPILMSSPMALATRNGTKTETRRIMDKVNVDPSRFVCFALDGVAHFDDLMLENAEVSDVLVNCPYGKVGDVLWIREPYYAYGKWVKYPVDCKLKWVFVDLTDIMPDKPYLYTDAIPQLSLIHI